MSKLRRAKRAKRQQQQQQVQENYIRARTHYFLSQQRPFREYKEAFVYVEDRDDETGRAQMYSDGEYNVAVYEADEQGIVCLTIQRGDAQPARDWRDLQRIKSELVGPEREAMEMFPAESRVIDLTNTTWLWVAPEGTRWPVGCEVGRMVRSLVA